MAPMREAVGRAEPVCNSFCLRLNIVSVGFGVRYIRSKEFMLRPDLLPQDACIEFIRFFWESISSRAAKQAMPSLASVGRRITFRNTTPALHTTEIRKIDTASRSGEKAPR